MLSKCTTLPSATTRAHRIRSRARTSTTLGHENVAQHGDSNSSSTLPSPNLIKDLNWSASPEGKAKYFHQLKSILKISRAQDWHAVPTHQLDSLGVSAVLDEHFQGRLDIALAEVYQQPGAWNPWEFKDNEHKLSKFWRDLENQRRYFAWLGSVLGVRDLEGWYSVKLQDFYAHGGTQLMWSIYNKSPRQAVTTLFPEHDWKPWRFTRVPHGYWDLEQHRREFLEWLAQKLGFSRDLSGWYTVDRGVVEEHGGRAMLAMYYKDSVAECVISLYPEHTWRRWMFRQVPKHFWEEEAQSVRLDEITSLLSHVAEKLKITSLDGWYRVSVEQTRQVGIAHILPRFGGLPRLLEKIFPDHIWEKRKFSGSTKRSAQLVLAKAVAAIFPHDNVIEEYCDPVNPRIQFDLFLPSKNLAFEYQGFQHFTPTSGSRRSTQHLNGADTRKMNASMQSGVTMIEIPYWWDGEKLSLAATIATIRPDLIIDSQHGTPIPTTAPGLQQTEKDGQTHRIGKRKRRKTALVQPARRDTHSEAPDCLQSVTEPCKLTPGVLEWNKEGYSTLFKETGGSLMTGSARKPSAWTDIIDFQVQAEPDWKKHSCK